MIFRRIAEHWKAQNWTAVTLEGVIVVVGVFLGIEASNWNEARFQRERAHDYLVRIRSDLEDDAASLQRRIDYWSAVTEQGRNALMYAESGERVAGSAWETLRAFLHAAEVWRFTYNATTYSELRSAGELKLITDPDLRSGLSHYYVTNPVRRGEGLYLLLPEYRQTVRGAVPSRVMRYYWDACHSDDQLTQTIVACSSPMTEQEAATILAAIMATPDLLPQLRYWIDSLGINTNLAALDRDAAIAMAARIDAAL